MRRIDQYVAPSLVEGTAMLGEAAAKLSMHSRA